MGGRDEILALMLANNCLAVLRSSQHSRTMGTLAKRAFDPRWHSFHAHWRDASRAAAPGGYMPRWPITAVILSPSVTLLSSALRNARARFVLTSTNEFGIDTGSGTPSDGKSQLFDTLDIPLVALGGHNGLVLYGISDTSTLIHFGNGSEIPVGPLGHDISSLAFETNGPSTMFGASYQDLYAINLSTAATTLIGHMGDFAESGLIRTS
jgi:hypothetical protein